MKLLKTNKKILIMIVIIWICLISIDYGFLIKGKQPVFMLSFSEKYDTNLNPVPKSYAIGLGYVAIYNFNIPGSLNDLDFYILFLRVVHLDNNG